MTNGEIKLVVKALCYALGDPERHYNIKVDNKGIVIEYRTANTLWAHGEPKYEIGTWYLNLYDDIFQLTDAVKNGIEYIELSKI